MKVNAANRAVIFASLLTVLVFGSLAATAQGTSSSERFQPLDVKLGLWESTWTIKVLGAVTIPAETLEKLTPEQRARFQERMNANSGGHTTTSTDQHCVTKEDLEQRKLELSASRECKPTVITSTSSIAKGKLVCEIEDLKAYATFDAEALDSQHVKGSARGSMNGGGRTMTFDSTFSSKWLGSVCGNVK